MDNNDKDKTANGQHEHNADALRDNEVVTGVAASLIATGLYSIFAEIFNSTMEEFSEYLPSYPVTLLIALIAAIILASALWAMKQYEKHLPSVIDNTISIILFCLLLFVTLRFCVILRFNITAYNNEETETYINLIKDEILSVLVLWYWGIIWYFVRLKYKELSEQSRMRALVDRLCTEGNSTADAIREAISRNESDMQNILKKMDFNTAVTSTVIPFSYDAQSKTISTYLISNPSYPEFTWMFPGGHVLFSDNQSPESIAIARANDEASLSVSLIDLHKDCATSETDNQVSNMTIFRAPDFLYLFKLDSNTKCFLEKGHEYHIDLVYVARINSVNNTKGAIDKVKIRLQDADLNQDEINNACHTALHKYYQKMRVKGSRQKNTPDYVERMLFEAFTAYRKYLRDLKQNL